MHRTRPAARLILAFVLVIVVIPGLLAAESPDSMGLVRPEPGDPILAVELDGLKRSKESYVLSVIKVAPGDSWYPDMETDIRDELIDEGSFQQETLVIESIPEENGVVLRIHVEDRWTLIPIPMGSASGDSWSVGLFIVESNLLGRGARLAGGFNYGSDALDLTLFGQYRSQAALVNHSIAQREDRTVSGGSEETLREYRLTNTVASLRPGFERGDWSGSWEFTYSGSSVDWDTGAAGLPEAEGGHAFATGPSIKYENTTHRSVFSSGFSAEIQSLYITPNFGSVLGTSTLGGLWGRTFLSAGLGAGWGETPDAWMFRLGGGSEAGRTLPGGVAAKSFVQGTARVERVLIPIGSTKLTGYGFYEVGGFQDLRDDAVLYHGPGLGLALHIDEIAIPALDFGFSWNVPLQKPYFSFSLGF